MKNIVITVLLISFIVVAVGFTGFRVTKVYGPYSGRVLSSETEKPIAGAVVLAKVYTFHPSFGGNVRYYASIYEAETDTDGRFLIPEFIAAKRKKPSWWEISPEFRVFYPGYGVYPFHPKVSSTITKGQWTIKLPPLSDKKERHKNLMSLFLEPEIPNSKITKTLKLIEHEKRQIE